METGQIALILLLLGSSGVLSDNTDSYVLNCGACAKAIFPNLDSFSCTVSCEVPEAEVNITGALSSLKDEINEEKKKTEEISELLARALEVLDENRRVLNETQQSLNRTQQELSDNVASQNTQVAFSVQLDNQPNLVSDAIIKYDLIQTNTGGAYSSTTGLFTAPSAGLYEFKIRLMTKNSGGSLGIFKSTETTSLCTGYTNTENIHSGCNVITSLHQGETVYAQNQYATTQYIGLYTTFSGIKL